MRLRRNVLHNALLYIYLTKLPPVSVIFYFLRIFQVYSVTRKLGSKIVTIRKMLWELASFLLILFIFMIPYGVASQAMLYPNAVKVNMEMVKNIFYYPYYRLYGELFLEEAEGEISFFCYAGPEQNRMTVAHLANQAVLNFRVKTMHECTPRRRFLRSRISLISF